jgi:peptidyl-tRNA hydrolase, PTH2 family
MAEKHEEYRHLLTLGDGPEREVSQSEWLSAERAAGFHHKPGLGPYATGGFSANGVRGRLERLEQKREELREAKQVIVIRRDLGMRRGKEIAQGAHASMKWLSNRLRPFARTPHTYTAAFTPAEDAWLSGLFTKVTCQVPDLDALEQVCKKAVEHGVLVNVITDAGRTEFAGEPTITCLAIGPDWAENVDKVTGDLHLY